MQPYLFPYLGYFQLIQAVETFVSCDNMQYTKKGWINRNRYLNHGKEDTFTLPLKNAHQKNDIIEREIASDFSAERLLLQFEKSYKRCSGFSENFPVIEEVLSFKERNLFHFILYSILRISNHLGIPTKIIPSSEIPVDHTLKKEQRVLAMCRCLGTSTYVNSSGGRSLYSPEFFAENGISLRFLDPEPFQYQQFTDTFVPWLSIVDVLMFNSAEKIKKQLTCYQLNS